MRRLRRPGARIPAWLVAMSLAATLLAEWVGFTFVAPPVAASEPVQAVPTASALQEAADWSAGDQRGTWDFEGPTDGWPLSPSENPPSAVDAWARPVDGSLLMSGRRTLHLLYAQSGAVPSLQNGHLRIDGTRWNHFSAYVHVDAPAFLFVQARHCDMQSAVSPRPDCVTTNVSNGRPLKAGWNLVVDHALFGETWNDGVAGVQVRVCPMVELRCSTDPATELRTELAWARLHDAPAPRLAVQLEGGTAERIEWERVDDRERASDRGDLLVTSSPHLMPLGVFEPGSYRLRAFDGVQWGPWSDPVEVLSHPRPVVLDPDAFGEDADWATVVRGNPWDMTGTDDVDRVDGVLNWEIANGWLRGVSVWSDPRATLALDGKRINTRRWHRLSVLVDNPGPWHITGESGVLGRLLWWPSDEPFGASAFTGDDVIVPGGMGWVNVDLATDPPERVEEMYGSGRGWRELGEVRAIRWDPHEVDDNRPFGVGEVRLARNDRVDVNRRFTVRWRDDAWRTGTVAEVALVPGPGAHGGEVIGTVAMTGPDGALNWQNPGTARGTYWVRVSLTTADGARTDAWSTGPLDVTERATFVDVPAASAAADHIDWMVAERLANGTADRYRPQEVTTRQAMAAFLYRLAGWPDGPSPTCGAKPFVDVGTDHMFCGEISWLARTEVAQGFLDGKFRPSDGITRGAMAAFMLRYASGRGHDVQRAPTCTEQPFPDVVREHIFCGYIAWVADIGVAHGYTDGSFRASAPITRGAMAAFVHRLHDSGFG